MRDHILQVPRSKYIRAKKIALEMIHGNQEEQYARIYNYLAELRGTNSGTTTICHLDNMLFVRMYGLVESVLEIFPNGEHRPCVRHLYSNFKSKPENQGKALKDCLWKAARATYLKEWTDAMNEMKAMSEPSFNWLQPKDPKQWSKSHFSSRCKSDILINNLSESFNKMVLESRDKPILTMMEMIGSKLMTRIATKKEAVEKIIGTLYAKIQKKVDKIIMQSTSCWPRHAGGHKWEVSARYEDQHVVDLEIQSCSCRKWDLTEIPCIHVASVIMKMGARVEEFVIPFYSKETQLKIYSHMIKPVRGLKRWAHYMTDEPILPPIIRRPVGRPQKKRRNEPDEPVTKIGRIRKIEAQMTCSKCGNRCHNKRSCKGQVGGNTSSNNNARVTPRKTVRVAQKRTANRSNTSAHATTAHARTSSTNNVIEPKRVLKLPLRRPTMSNPATSSSYPQQGSQQSQGYGMLVRWMLSQHSTAKEPQTHE
ncbi:hypothetical protein V6N13_083956 [Hibiscus sabdariffa]